MREHPEFAGLDKHAEKFSHAMSAGRFGGPGDRLAIPEFQFAIIRFIIEVDNHVNSFREQFGAK